MLRLMYGEPNMVAWYLGHDDKEYLIDVEFLRQDGLWCHAKRNQVILSYGRRPKHTLFCTRYRFCCTNNKRLFLDKLVLSNDQKKYLCYCHHYQEMFQIM